MLYYKFLHEDGSAIYGRGKWFLPEGNKPAKWMPEIKGDLMPCNNGYHLCREKDLLKWLGPALYVAEYKGELVEADDKVVVRKARLISKVEQYNERALRLFACDCAERVLHIFEKHFPKDDRPRKAIEVARRFANGGATKGELGSAAAAADSAAAAANAAHAVAAAATYAAANAADSVAVATYAVAHAAHAVAAAATYAVAHAAAANAAANAADSVAVANAAATHACAAEKQWQLSKLRTYLNI